MNHFQKTKRKKVYQKILDKIKSKNKLWYAILFFALVSIIIGNNPKNAHAQPETPQSNPDFNKNYYITKYPVNGKTYLLAIPEGMEDPSQEIFWFYYSGPVNTSIFRTNQDIQEEHYTHYFTMVGFYRNYYDYETYLFVKTNENGAITSPGDIYIGIANRTQETNIRKLTSINLRYSSDVPITITSQSNFPTDRPPIARLIAPREPGSDPGTDPCEEVCNSGISEIFNFRQGFNCLLCITLETIKDFCILILNWAKSIIESTIYLPSSQLDKDFIRLTHKSLLDIGNFLAVIGFLIIIFANLLRLDLPQYAIKTMLPRLLLAIILMNFSLLITKVVVDFANILTKEALLMPHLSSNIGATENAGSAILGTLGAGGAAGFVTFSYLTGLISATPPGQITIAIFILTLLLFPIFIALGIAFFMIIRNMFIWGLAIVAPLAFLFMVLPFTQRFHSLWWSELACWSFKAPVVALLIALSEKVISSLGSTIDYNQLVEDPGNVNWLVPFFSMAFLFMAFIVASTMCGKINKTLSTAFKEIKKGGSLIIGSIRKPDNSRINNPPPSGPTTGGSADGLEKVSSNIKGIPDTQTRKQELINRARKAAIDFQRQTIRYNEADIRQRAIEGDKGAQAFAILNGIEFPGIDKVVNEDIELKALAEQTRPDLVFNNTEIREKIDRGEIDLKKVNPQTITALSSRGFHFTDSDIRTIISSTNPLLLSNLQLHYSNNPEEFNKLKKETQETIKKIIPFTRTTDRSDNEE